jgi:AraC-like DNA-binding protein
MAFNSFETVLATLQTTTVCVDRTLCRSNWGGEQTYSDPFGRLYWVRMGEGWTTHHGRRFHLLPGALFVVPAHVSSQYRCPHQMDLCWAHFTARVLHGIDLFTFLEGCYEVSVADVAWIDACWDELLRRRDEEGPGAHAARDGILRLLLSRFIEQFDTEAHDRQVRGIAQFHEVLAHIEQHLSGKLTLMELADIAHLQPTYFSNRFAAVMGEGIMAYINRRRVERAKTLLWDTTLPLQAVAVAVGFCDEHYFSRIFKRCTQLTPGKFRTQQGNRP